jgi:transcriptional regulator with XRE-family HTH domain
MLQEAHMEKSRFDTERFFAALDAQRDARDLNWKQVADESGVSASTLTRMAQGKRPDIDGLAALLEWSGLSAKEFFTGEQAKKKPEALAVISTHLRADPRLSKENAAALVEIIKVAYKRLADID